MYAMKLNHCAVQTFTFLLSSIFIFASFSAQAEQATDYVSIPPLINLSASGDKPNVLFVLDNSNSMDEAPSGQAVGSANPGSKSEIARNAVKDIITNYQSTTRMGLMAYQQSGVARRRLHDSQYDISYNPANYDPTFTGPRDSETKRYRVPNPSDPGAYLYYNIALPFYSSANNGSMFCYSTTADFDNGSEIAGFGPWDNYSCYSRKTGTNDDFNNYSNHRFTTRLSPTDSDYAQNILDFGTNLSWQYVSYTWYVNSSPGKGYLHAEVDDVDTAHYNALINKLGTSQFDASTDTPLRNAGLTPIAGTLQSASSYFQGTLPSSESFTSGTPSAPPTNSCDQQDYVILVTDGMPSVDPAGNEMADTTAAINAAAAEAANLLSQGIKTYVIGFALPNGVDGSLLDTIAAAGGTDNTFLANDAASLDSALKSIFLTFVNRDASSSSSAVLANNSRGEGAIFQAIYSPEREDALNNRVTWVGNLFGLFIDDRGYIREDTNGNARLDDYITDRTVEYFFHTGLGRTQVNRYVGADANTPPSFATSTPVDTVDVDDMATIWEARKPLSDITDVLTQRPYTNSAANGRHILTSIDGTSVLDFVEVSADTLDDLIAARDAAQSTLTDAQNYLNFTLAQRDAAQTTVTELSDANSTAVDDFNAAQAALDAAQTNLDNANDALTAAQAEIATTETAYQGSENTWTSNATNYLNESLNSATDLQNALSSLPDATTDFDALVNEAITAGADTGDAAVTTAQANLAAAMSAASNNQTALSNDIANLQTSLSDHQANTNILVNDLVNTDSLSAANQSIIENENSTLATSYQNAQMTNGSVTAAAVQAARLNYYNALIATGVDDSLPNIQSALTAYNSTQASETTAVETLTSNFDNILSTHYTNYYNANTDIVSNYDDWQSAITDEANAQTAITNAQTQVVTTTLARDNAQAALSDAEGELVAAQELLTTSTDAYDNALASYNAALAAYNTAVATVNNSSELVNHLDVANIEEAFKTIRFIRGDDTVEGYRSRAVDFDGDGLTEVWRLSDIIHSSPVLVGAPSDQYDSLYLDNTYASFRETYKNRRNVIYTGANDGMLHAFNAGFWSLADKTFSTTSPDGGATAHPLGSELWAYIPRSALPHLQWLTDASYAHSYYVDGPPITFDANIFPADAAHPFGWGTVLMIGMRFGGGDIDIDSDADGTDDTTLRSSYILLDVTNPEVPPTLLGEISHPELGFSQANRRSLKTDKRPPLIPTHLKMNG